jgi:hypothetical protein
MTTERLLELVMLTNTFDSIIHASGVNENGEIEIEFEGGIYDVKAMVTRQTELFKEFIAPYEVAGEAYVIEDTEKSE